MSVLSVGAPGSGSVGLARTIVATMISQGIEWVVLAPGSRNAPLALALAAAEGQGLLRIHVRVDERSAGFVALGLARASENPVAVVTTSGTAVGNLLPAVMEARHAGVPLLVLSADRPASMINSGASQTTNQLGTLAGHVLDVARVSSESGGHADWRHQVRRSLALAAGVRTRQPGPVQLNVELAMPLVGSELNEPLELEEGQQLLAARADCWGAHAISPGPRTVVLAGDCRPGVGARAVAFAEANNLPLLAEPSSNARQGATAIATYRLLLADLGSQVERVVVFGHPTLSRPVTQLLAREDIELIMVAEDAEWIDPGHQAAVVCDDIEMDAPASEEWLGRWLEADAQRLAQLDTASSSVAASPDVGEGLDPRAVHHVLWSALDAEDVVMLGSSNPVRDADLLPVHDQPPVVFANRGLAGIDGTISSAIGLALSLARPVTTIVGDLTFIHDLSALVFGELERVPDLRVMVLDDRGGSIFQGLEQGAETYAEHFERVFGTPQRVHLAAAARGIGVETSECVSLDDLARALARPISGLEVIVVGVDRSRRPRPDASPRPGTQP